MTLGDLYRFTLGIVILLFAIALLWPWPAGAQNSAVSDPFWNSYYAAQAGGNTGAIIANQRNTEALINEMRAARGQPPCSIGLIGQWQGRPAC